MPAAVRKRLGGGKTSPDAPVDQVAAAQRWPRTEDNYYELRDREQQIAPDRLAAEHTLEQLELCVNYLRRIGKRRIAQVIDNNRRFIRARCAETGGRNGAPR